MLRPSPAGHGALNVDDGRSWRGRSMGYPHQLVSFWAGVAVVVVFARSSRRRWKAAAACAWSASSAHSCWISSPVTAGGGVGSSGRFQARER